MTFLVLALGLVAGDPAPGNLRGQFRMAVIEKPGGSVAVACRLEGDSLLVSASIPDTSYSWGDDFVVSLDPDGSGGVAPGDGDRQWYIRRDADSSVVSVASAGRWAAPGVDPARIGAARSGDGWSLTASSDSSGWKCSLRIAWSEVGSSARIAFRTYDDAPRGWWSLPEPREGERATLIERTPDRWIPIPFTYSSR